MLNLLPEYPKILHYYLKTSFIQINLMLQTFRSPCAEPKALSLIFIYIETASSCGRNMRLASLPRTQSDIMTQSSGICMIIVTCVSTASEEYSAIPRDASWLLIIVVKANLLPSPKFTCSIRIICYRILPQKRNRTPAASSNIIRSIACK